MDRQDIFGSFHLADTEFAIEVSHIQEVVNTPDKYTSLPLSPPHLLGLFNLRGTIVPIVDLRVLLKFPGETSKKEQKIAILELRGHCIGILFEQTGEIFRSQGEETSEFSDLNTDAIIKGVFKKEGGQRLIQILDVLALFNLKELPRESNQSREESHKLARNRKGLRKQCISFLVGPAKLALGIAEIQEILKFDKIDNSALGGGVCIGIINLRGVTVPVIDFASVLAYRLSNDSQNIPQADRRIIVMRLRDEFFGMLVDSVDSIVTYYEENLKAFPTLMSSRKDMFVGCISIEEKEDILLLDFKNVLSNAEVQQVTHGHSQIYKAASKDLTGSKKEAGLRRTFITFSVENLFAVLISEVKEIIDYPPKLLQPPGLPPYCKGVLNLRGDLVTIVDARELYRISTKNDQLPQKVLVFNNGTQHFGLVVDSVEAIVSITDENKVKLPEVLFAKAKGMSDDVQEAIHCKDSNGNTQNMLILNAQAIATRLAEAG